MRAVRQRELAVAVRVPSKDAVRAAPTFAHAADVADVAASVVTRRQQEIKAPTSSSSSEQAHYPPTFLVFNLLFS